MRVTPRVLGIFLLAVLWLPGSPLGIRYDRPAPSGRGERIYLQQHLGPACTLTEPLRCLRAVRGASTLAQTSGAEPQGEPALCPRRDPLSRSASQAPASNLGTGHLHFLGLPVARPRAPCPA